MPACLRLTAFIICLITLLRSGPGWPSSQTSARSGCLVAQFDLRKPNSGRTLSLRELWDFFEENHRQFTDTKFDRLRRAYFKLAPKFDSILIQPERFQGRPQDEGFALLPSPDEGGFPALVFRDAASAKAQAANALLHWEAAFEKAVANRSKAVPEPYQGLFRSILMQASADTLPETQRLLDLFIAEGGKLRVDPNHEGTGRFAPPTAPGESPELVFDSTAQIEEHGRSIFGDARAWLIEQANREREIPVDAQGNQLLDDAYSKHSTQDYDLIREAYYKYRPRFDGFTLSPARFRDALPEEGFKVLPAVEPDGFPNLVFRDRGALKSQFGPTFVEWRRALQNTIESKVEKVNIPYRGLYRSILETASRRTHAKTLHLFRRFVEEGGVVRLNASDIGFHRKSSTFPALFLASELP